MRFLHKCHMSSQLQDERNHSLVACLPCEIIRQWYYCSFLEHNLWNNEETATLSTTPSHHIARQCSCVCSANCGWCIGSLGGEVLYHPLYSSDLSPRDYDRMTKMKERLHGIRFLTVPEILQAVDCSIRMIHSNRHCQQHSATFWTLVTVTRQRWLVLWRDIKCFTPVFLLFFFVHT